MSNSLSVSLSPRTAETIETKFICTLSPGNPTSGLQERALAEDFSLISCFPDGLCFLCCSSFIFSSQKWKQAPRIMFPCSLTHQSLHGQSLCSSSGVALQREPCDPATETDKLVGYWHLPVSQGEPGNHKAGQTKALWLRWSWPMDAGLARRVLCTHSSLHSPMSNTTATACKSVRILSLHNPLRISDGCLYLLWHSTGNQERDIWSIRAVWCNLIVEAKRGCHARVVCLAL